MSGTTRAPGARPGGLRVAGLGERGAQLRRERLQLRDAAALQGQQVRLRAPRRPFDLGGAGAEGKGGVRGGGPRARMQAGGRLGARPAPSSSRRSAARSRAAASAAQRMASCAARRASSSRLTASGAAMVAAVTAP